MSPQFKSWLAVYFERFIAIKRAGGRHYDTEEYLLARFDQYLVEQSPTAPLQTQTLLAFLVPLERLSPRSRYNLIHVVWQALTYARLHGAPVDRLPQRPQAPPYRSLRPPRIVLHEEIRAIISAARRLSPTSPLRSATYATLYGLLFATGLRIGEALALNIGDLDFDSGLLTVRHGKMDKIRILPLRPTTVAVLKMYVNNPPRPNHRSTESPLFLSSRRLRLAESTTQQVLKKLSTAAAIAAPLPRPHDLRHSFAVLCVIAWYKAGRDVNLLLPALSTYLGHVSVENTRIYLQANAILLEEASRRFASKTAPLDEVLS